jgi:hypothetical protein
LTISSNSLGEERTYADKFAIAQGERERELWWRDKVFSAVMWWKFKATRRCLAATKSQRHIMHPHLATIGEEQPTRHKWLST